MHYRLAFCLRAVVALFSLPLFRFFLVQMPLMDTRLIRKINRAEQEIEDEVDAGAKDETDGKFGDKDGIQCGS